MCENIVILGSGPASYVAAIYAATAGLKPLVLEEETPTTLSFSHSHKIPGICQELSNSEYIGLIKKQAERFHVRIIQKKVTSIEINNYITLRSGNDLFQTKACIIDDFTIKKRLCDSFDNLESIESVFLCGTAKEMNSLGVIIAGSGCVAALDAEKYLENKIYP